MPVKVAAFVGRDSRLPLVRSTNVPHSSQSGGKHIHAIPRVASPVLPVRGTDASVQDGSHSINPLAGSLWWNSGNAQLVGDGLTCWTQGHRSPIVSAEIGFRPDSFRAPKSWEFKILTAGVCVSTRTLIKPLEFHFWTPYPSFFEDDQCAKKRAAGLVGRHSSILVDPFFARGLAICYDEIGLPDRVPNQMQNQHVFLCGFFTHDFTCVCRSIKARDNLSSFVISMRTDHRSAY